MNDIYYKETILNFAFQLSMHCVELSAHVNVTCSGDVGDASANCASATGLVVGTVEDETFNSNILKQSL